MSSKMSFKTPFGKLFISPEMLLWADVCATQARPSERNSKIGQSNNLIFSIIFPFRPQQNLPAELLFGRNH
jgi:hypothetical protein